MVSIRRRRYLGLCSGKGSSPVVVPKYIEIPTADENSSRHVKTVALHPVPSVETSLQKLAAIKVDKKQIHLGIVGSQEEAAQLYDRAAFMCGREPNFELLAEEKQELREYNWEEFLMMMRSAINNMKNQRRLSPGKRNKLPEAQISSSNWEQEGGSHDSSMSDNNEDTDANISALRP